MTPAEVKAAREVASFVDVDVYGCRAEGERRQIAAEKALAKALRAVEKARREIHDSALIIEACFAQQQKEWAA